MREKMSGQLGSTFQCFVPMLLIIARSPKPMTIITAQRYLEMTLKTKKAALKRCDFTSSSKLRTKIKLYIIYGFFGSFFNIYILYTNTRTHTHTYMTM